MAIADSFFQDSGDGASSSMINVTNFLDLAASSKRKMILKHLVSHGLTDHREEFENFLMSTEFSYPGEIFDEIVKENSKVAKNILSTCVDSVSENTEDTFMKIDLKVFSNPNAVETLLVNGNKDLPS